MGTVSGLLALTMLGAEPAEASTKSTPNKPITCQAEVMTLNALTWRPMLGSDLDSIHRTGKTTVWVVPRVAVPLLNRMAEKQSSPAPIVCATPDAPVSVSVARSVSYYQHQRVGRVGPILINEDQLGQTSAPLPISEISVEENRVEEKFEVRCSARRLDQGTLASVRVADTHLVALHKVPSAQEAGIEEFDCNVGDGARCVGPMVEAASAALDIAANALMPSSLAQLAGMVVDTLNPAFNPPVTLGKIEIPEVVAATVEGEWLVPEDSVLIVSLGVHTGADAQGKAVARERVAVLDFGTKPGRVTVPAAAARIFPASNVVRACEANEPPPMPIALSQLNMPAVPARSLPEAVDKDGQVIDLPPLPEAYAAADLNQIKPGSPQATPQAPLVQHPSPRPVTDPQLARTSFEAPGTEEVIGVDFDFAHGGQMTQIVQVGPNAAARSAQLANLVEGFFRRGLAPCPTDDSAPPCPAAAGDCPVSLTIGGCPALKAEVEPASADKPNLRTTFAAALQTPGTIETRFIPLGKGLALEVRVRVVPEPREVGLECEGTGSGHKAGEDR